ncbi:ImmA/IrrE family metallo-endopeptidase, partial [Enterococcus faecalis]|nr:ImmA/IrrE family metallo-endopeptidase [Enterococcus faecalis]
MFNGEKLRDIRMLNGLSRKELASLIGISEQAIWQYENSTIHPRIDIISEFSRFFNVDSRFFITKNTLSYKVREESIAYRNVDREQRSKTSSEAMYLEFVDDLISQMNNKFEGISGLINYITTEVEKMRSSGATVAECASFVRGKLNVFSNKNLLLAVERAGVIVLEKVFTSNKTDAYSSWVGDTAYIVLGSTRKTLVRRNFDIVHELGHLVLHRKVSITSLTKEEFREVENEANEFASSFLLPDEDGCALVLFFFFFFYLPLPLPPPLSFSLPFFSFPFPSLFLPPSPSSLSSLYLLFSPFLLLPPPPLLP